jgi:hypothetical protein
MTAQPLTVTLWTEAEPGIEARDVAAVGAFAPDIAYTPPMVSVDQIFHGGWKGRLPLWPFDRPEPAGLTELVPSGVFVRVMYPAAYPMVPPRVYALDPEPSIDERTQQIWHVAPGGSLCLLQTEEDWTPQTTPVDLLLKAAGWRIEYALMKAGVVEVMTTNGIVNDDSRDALIADAAAL